MDDKQETQEEKPEDPVKTEDAGVQQETNRTVDDINLASKRSEEAAEKLRIENERMENNYAKMKMGGTTEAGTAPTGPQYSDEEKASRARIKAVGDASGSAWAKDYE